MYWIRLKAASQLKMGKGGMHNPVSCNCAINPFYRNLRYILFS